MFFWFPRNKTKNKEKYPKYSKVNCSFGSLEIKRKIRESSSGRTLRYGRERLTTVLNQSFC